LKLIGNCLWAAPDITLPVSQHAPALTLQRYDLRTVTASVPFDLCDPIVGIEASRELLFETAPVLPVPEVAIAEDDGTMRREHQIWSAGQLRGMGPIAEAAGTQFPSKQLLWLGVLREISSH
jgi:hypothetical protein